MKETVMQGKPYAGNPHVRFDEGAGASRHSGRSALLYKYLLLSSAAIESIKGLPKIHGDPFDRILIAQALTGNMVIVTSDGVMPQYPVRTVW